MKGFFLAFFVSNKPNGANQPRVYESAAFVLLGMLPFTNLLTQFEDQKFRWLQGRKTYQDIDNALVDVVLVGCSPITPNKIGLLW